MAQTQSIQRNYIFSLLLKFSAVVFPLITYPYLTRVLGEEGLGKVALAVSITECFTTISSLGIPTYGIVVCSRLRESKSEFIKTAWELLLIQFAMTAVSCVCYLSFILAFPKLRQESVLYAIQLFGLATNVWNSDWVYEALEQYQFLAKRTIAVRVLTTTLIFLGIHSSSDYILYAFTISLFTILSNGINFLILRKAFLPQPRCCNVRPHIRPLVIYLGQTVATMLYTNMDSIMLGFISGDAELGIYSIAVKVKTVITSVITAVGTVLMPRLSYYISAGKEKKAFDLLKASFHIIFLISFPCSIFLAAVSGELLSLVLGINNEAAYVTLKIIAPSLVFIGLSNILGYGFLSSVRQEACVLKSVAIGAAVNFALNAVLIPMLGARGAALGTSVTELVVLVVQIVFAYRLIPKMTSDSWLKVVKAALCAIAASAVFWVARQYISGIWMRFCLESAGYWILYGLLLIVSRDTIAGAIVCRVKELIRQAIGLK